MRVAAAQISCALGDVKTNIAKIRDSSSRAKGTGAEIIVFPEMSDTGYAMQVIAQRAGSWNDGAVPELQELANKIGIAIVSGVSEREGPAIYNSQVVIASSGAILAKYRKTHLFAVAPINEHTCFVPGKELSVCEVGEFRLGLSICYDLRFPELYRCLAAEKESTLFIISSAWPLPRVEHFRVLAVARAIENQSYVVAANRVGKDDGITFGGSSVIIDPYGTVLAAASADREELIYADLSMETVVSVRKQMPVFAHRRPELYR